MPSRRGLLCAGASGCLLGLSGCLDSLTGGPEPAVGEIHVPADLVDEEHESVTVTVPVTNDGASGQIRVTVHVVDHDGERLDTDTEVVALDADETRDVEFAVTPRQDAAGIEGEAIAE